MNLYRRLITPTTLAVLDDFYKSRDTTGTTPEDDLDTLTAILFAANAKRILQMGTFLGGSALVLADIARQNGGADALVVTVDPNAAMNDSCRELAMKAGLELTVKTIDGFSTDGDLLRRFSDTEWDVIYLDTTHQYGQTLAEIRALARLCSDRTLLLFHDASKFAAETLDTGKQGGVRRAMQEYCLLNAGWQYFVFESAPFGKYGIGAMQRAK